MAVSTAQSWAFRMTAQLFEWAQERNMATDLRPLTADKLKDLSRPTSERIMKWRFFKAEKGIETTKCDGSRVSIHGVKYAGSVPTVYWSGFFEPFMLRAASETLGWVAEHCNANRINPVAYIDEARLLIHEFVKTSYREIAITDQILRADGFKDAGRWCRNRNSGGPWAPTSLSIGDRDRRRSAKGSHAVEDVACESRFDFSRARIARAKPVTDYRFVSVDGILDSTLPMVSSLALPSSLSYFLDPFDGLIAARTSSPANGRVACWGNDDGGTAIRCRCIEWSGVVGGIRDDGADIALDPTEELGAGRGVIDIGIGQALNHDETFGVDAEMELPPALSASAAVFRCSPLTLAEDGETAAVNDEVDRAGATR